MINAQADQEAAAEASFRAVSEYVAKELGRPKWTRSPSEAVNALLGPSSPAHLSAVVLTNYHAFRRTLGEPTASRIVELATPRFRGAGRPSDPCQRAASLVRKALKRTVRHRPITWRAHMLAITYETFEAMHLQIGRPFNVSIFARLVATNEHGHFDWYDGSRREHSVRKQLALIWPGGLTRSNRTKRASP